MRRSLSVFLWIILGACASALGMGYVLFRAQAEQRTLSQQLERTQEQARAIAENHERLIQEADQRIALANAEAAQTRERLHIYEEERILLEQTPPLSGFSQRTKTWSQFVAFPLGLSLRLPPGTFTTTTEQSLLSTQGGTSYQTGELWLSISPYTHEQEQELIQGFVNTSSFAYRIDQTLLLGQRGHKDGVSGDIFLVRVQRAGKPSYLIWAKTVPSLPEPRLLETLSTLSFAT